MWMGLHSCCSGGTAISWWSTPNARHTQRNSAAKCLRGFSLQNVLDRVHRGSALGGRGPPTAIVPAPVQAAADEASAYIPAVPPPVSKPHLRHRSARGSQGVHGQLARCVPRCRADAVVPARGVHRGLCRISRNRHGRFSPSRVSPRRSGENTSADGNRPFSSKVEKVRTRPGERVIDTHPPILSPASVGVTDPIRNSLALPRIARRDRRRTSGDALCRDNKRPVSRSGIRGTRSRSHAGPVISAAVLERALRGKTGHLPPAHGAPPSDPFGSPIEVR